VWLYRARIHDWHLNWGAQDEEINARLPGDDLIEGADLVANRAIRIDAPVSAIWPWLVQMGPGRGGAYTYDWIEEPLRPGDAQRRRDPPGVAATRARRRPLGPAGAEPGLNAMRVRVLDPERTLVTASDDGTWVWGFYLLPEDGGTRLLSRNTIKTGSSLGAKIGMALMSPGSWVMERKMLLGIKDRAEKLAREPVTA
jgi:hypothetical protein